MRKKKRIRVLSRSEQMDCSKPSACFFFLVDQLLGDFIERNKMPNKGTVTKKTNKIIIHNWARIHTQINLTNKNVNISIDSDICRVYCVAMVFYGHLYGSLAPFFRESFLRLITASSSSLYPPLPTYTFFCMLFCFLFFTFVHFLCVVVVVRRHCMDSPKWFSVSIRIIVLCLT